MSKEIAQQLKEALQLMRAGKNAQAQPILAKVLRADPQNESAWYLTAASTEDTERKIYALKQVLRINPNHEKALEWLDRFTQEQAQAAAPPLPPRPDEAIAVESPAEAGFDLRSQLGDSPAQAAWTGMPEEDEPPAQKRALPVVPLAITGGVLVLVCLIVSILLVNQNFFASKPPTPEAVVLPSETPFPTFTSIPLELSTDTPEPAQTVEVILLPTAEEEGEAVPPVLLNPEDVAALRQEAAQTRQIQAGEDGEAYLIEPNQKGLFVLLSDAFSGAEFQTQVSDAARVLYALGLAPVDFDATKDALNRQADSLGGLYLPAENRIYVFGSSLDSVEKYIYVYEYSLVLLDQQFGLSGTGKYPNCVAVSDACMALRALTQGDASLNAYLWWSEFSNPQDFAPISQYKPPAQTLNDPLTPPYAVPNLAFPLEQGRVFVEALQSNGGWTAVNAAYGALVLTTEHILHPEKYSAGEKPAVVEDKPLSDVLINFWEPVANDTLGEWFTYLLLRYGADSNYQLAEAVARTAAEGWAGDQYQVYYNETDEATVIAAHWLWDSEEDAEEFAVALTDYAVRRTGGILSVQMDNGKCGYNKGGDTCVLRVGKQVLWIWSEDDSALKNVLTLYPGF